MTGRTLVQEPAAVDTPAPSAPPWFLIFVAVAIVAVMLLRRRAGSPNLRPSAGPEGPDSGRTPDVFQQEEVERLDPEKPVAVFLVGGSNRLEPASIRIFRSTYAQEYRQMMFLSVGLYDYEVMDSGVSDGGYADPEKAKHLRLKTRLSLDPYLAVAHDLGMTADCRVSIATDPVAEIDRMSTQIAVHYPRAVFFVSKLVFRRFNWFHRLFQSGTSDAIRRRLEDKGFPVTIIPLVLPL